MLVIRKFSFIQFLSFMAVITTPLISLPFLPATYKPLSLIFLMPLCFFYLVSFRLTKIDFFILIFMVFSGVYSVSIVFYSGAFGESFFLELVVFVLGGASYFGFKSIFSTIGWRKFFSYYIFSYRFVLVLGVVEVLAVLGLLPMEAKEIVNYTFSEKHHERVQLTTMEPSWAGRLLIFYLPVVIYFYFNKKDLLVRFWEVFLGLFLLFMVFSIDSLMIFFSAILLYLIINKKYISLLVLFVFGLFFVFVIGEVAIGSSGYYMERLVAIADGDFYSVGDLIFLDQSVFIRIGYIVVAYSVFLDYPLGVGMGQYSNYFTAALIENFGVSVLSFPEVFLDVQSDDGDPRSLVMKVLVEFGLIFFYGFCLDFIDCIRC